MKFGHESISMIRIALTAYLSLMAALGPALCCCNLRYLLAGADTFSCCGKMHAKAVPGADHQGHAAHNHHGHSHQHGDHPHHHHAQGSSPAAPANSTSLPQNHDGKDCPCGGQDELIAIGTDAKPLVLQNQATLLFAVALPIQLQVSVVEATSIPQVRPSLLAGRELLRAYQIMRC